MMVQKALSLDSLLSRRARQARGVSPAGPPSGDVISFGWGLPDGASLPLRQLSNAAVTVLASHGREALQYGGSFGDQELRQTLARRQAAQQGTPLDPTQIILTNGSSQALDLVCDTLLDPEDVVLAEEPAFSLSLTTIRAYGAELVGVPVDEQGMEVDRLAAALDGLQGQGRRVKLIYTIPDFQNPTGSTLALDRRRALAGLARDRGILLVEDTAYRELRYEGDSLPSLLSLAGEAAVQMGSFSKTIGPGLRVGYLLVGDGELAQRLAGVRRDMGSSPFLARLVAEFIQGGFYDPHLQDLRTLYRAKRDALERALGELCRDAATWTPPAGGFFFWLRLRGEADARQLLPLAEEAGVSFMPGSRFFLEERPEPFLRLAFSSLHMAQVRQGVERLARALKRLGEGE